MSSKTLHVLFLLCLSLVLNAIAAAFAQGTLPQLISARMPRGTASIAAEGPSSVHPRSNRITIDTALLAILTLQIDETRDGKYPRIEVRPFDDVVLTVEVRETDLETKDHEMRNFRGYVLGLLPGKPDLSPIGRFGINVKDGVVQGTIYLQEISYQFRYVSGDGQIVRVFDPARAPPGGQPIVPAAPVKKTSTLEKAPEVSAVAAGTPASPDIIDVLVVYTAAARIAAGGGEPVIKSNINAAIGSANHAYVESNVNQRIRLAFAGETAFVETSSQNGDLTAMQGATSALKDMRRWRDQFAADMVNLWSAQPSSESCGLAFQPPTVGQLVDIYAFSTIPQDCFDPLNLAFVHELGHNMGLGHDLAAAQPPGPTIYPYGHGFVGLAGTPPFRTVMAYSTSCAGGLASSCPIQKLFSNTSITRNGIVAGDATNSNESLALNNVSVVAAGLRTAGPLKDIKAGIPNGTDFATVAGTNGTAYFVGDDGINGAELWKSDGSREGTVLVKDIRTGATGSGIMKLFVSADGAVFFSAFDGNGSQTQLWKSDGTTGGTVFVKALGFGDASAFIEANGTIFFFFGQNFDQALWKTDGTAGGTIVITPSVSGEAINPQWTAAANGLFFFTANDAIASNPQLGDILWSSNGTTTTRVKDIYPFNEALIYGLTGVGNLLYFAAEDAANGRELWKSNGTTAGTVVVKDINPGASPSFPTGLTPVNTMVFFTANDGVNGPELWKSDGSAGGTVMVKDIRPGAIGSSIVNFINVNGTLFFTANDGTNGVELWKSDGTIAGTVMVKDIAVGIGSSSPRSLVAHSTGLYFIADDGVRGAQLWKSDGTMIGTMMVTVPGLPANFTSVASMFISGDQLFFAATNGTTGLEPYAVSLPARNTIPSAFAFTPLTEVSLGIVQVSNTVTVSGIDTAVPVAVDGTGSEYSIGCTLSFTALTGSISNGQTVCVRHTTASIPNGLVNTTLTIGGLSAVFPTTTLGPKSLTVAKSGTGTGTVTSAPAGISCGSTCTANFASGALVTLTATAVTGSGFAGWSGACAGSGTCDVTMDATKSVTAMFSTVPNAPSSPSAVPGNASAMFSFTAFSDSSAPITSFTVDCNMGAITVTGTSSPIRIVGLTNDVALTCTITATNLVGTSAPSPFVNVTPTASAPLTLVGVKSRKAHGPAGVFDMPVNTSVALSGAVSVEPRTGATHSLIFQFNDSPGSVSGATSTPSGTAIPTISASEIVVTLSGIGNNQRVLVSITGVNGATNYQAPIGFLAGDVNNSKTTNSTDIASTKSHSGQKTNSGNFLFDINLSGVVGAADIAGVKARQGQALP